jgi:cell division protease FtsH
MNQMTTGASNDFERATQMARDMVTRYGMSDELGPMVYGENEGEVFLGRSVTTHKNMSEATMQKVDARSAASSTSSTRSPVACWRRTATRSRR